MNVCSGMDGAAPSTCIIECDDATGDYIAHLQICGLHQGFADAGMDGPAIHKQTQFDSMRWARTCQTLEQKFPDGQFQVVFNDDQTIEVKILDAGSSKVGEIDSAISEAVATCPIMARLRTEFSDVSKGKDLVDLPVSAALEVSAEIIPITGGRG